MNETKGLNDFINKEPQSLDDILQQDNDRSVLNDLKEIMQEPLEEPEESETNNSTHRCEVIEIGQIQKHPNADTLGIVKVWDYDVVVKLADWNEGAWAFYVTPDSVVPDIAEFAFLDGHRRIKARKLRDIWSQGLLIPYRTFIVEDGSEIVPQLGDDVAELMGIKHYVPKMHSAGIKSGLCEKGPEDIIASDYDVENGLKYARKEFIEGEEVVATEKIHGCVEFDTLIDTLEYGNIKIGEVVEKKLDVTVKSFDFEKNEIRFNKVYDFSKLQNNNDWYEIETEDGKILKITGEHLVYNQTINEYQKVENLKSGEFVIIL